MGRFKHTMTQRERERERARGYIHNAFTCMCVVCFVVSRLVHLLAKDESLHLHVQECFKGG